ncbi:catabolite control protein A [Staphylococcus warneri]|jgi:LacI family transcriptional regulator|uniref:Catabolite control protein A n=1 Tax=Staphylococcus warneri TaxID=1292 RepID=A0A2T4Q1T4_STAWA|nr:MULTISPECIES: catabolite control protein A [Staphylococcus]MBE9428220.1 catabolite control protein A [Staphylococcus epidermidis]MBY6178297.1 catabolite control protein A [Staphylococcaceae bacterium DP2N0-1]AXV42117.1 global transcriptional regulator, catabolite control protein A [Staphylococcus sp. M0911]EEQ79041.1 catabolite control protein A [Staphylococcus warneri L37603]MBO0377662.1 catabolite control protein A [Staphylococcus warneri]
MTVTIYDVAREARVSMATVSRVVNGNQNVKPETRNKVNEVIKKLNYRPNAVARGLASKRTTTVGVIIPDISNVYYSQLARGLEDIATMYKYHSIISNSDNDSEKEKEIFNNLLSKQVDGIIFLGGTISEEIKELINQSSVPVVVSGTNGKDDHVASVNIDFEKAAEEVTQQLIEQGAKSFALVGGDYSKKAQEDVLSGLNKVLSKNQLQLDDSLHLSGAESYKEGMKVFDKIKDNLPDAVLSISDEQAIGILHGALDAGIKVPEELQIVSFNNTRLVEMVRPQLSSVIQPLYDIGAVGMRLLTKYMNEEEIDEPNVILPHRIEYRGTTK